MFYDLVLVVAQCDQIGRLLHFGQLFKACGNIFLPKSPTFLGDFCKGVNLSFMGNFYRHLATFYWSHSM